VGLALRAFVLVSGARDVDPVVIEGSGGARHAFSDTDVPPEPDPLPRTAVLR